MQKPDSNPPSRPLPDPPSRPSQVGRNGVAAGASLFPQDPRIAVVVNGNAKSVTQEVISTLDQILAGGDLFVSKNLEDAGHIARTLISRGYGTVLTGGGDGTFTVMVSEVVREGRKQNKPLPRFGLLKLGTGNALAWVVGARDPQSGELAADIKRLTEDAGSRTIRLIEVEGFNAPFCGFGADADVLADYSKVKSSLQKTPLKRVAPGLLSYGVAAITRSIPSYLLKRMPHCRIVNTGGEAFRIGAKGAILGRPIARGAVIYEGPMRLCGLSTIPYYGYGFRMFPFAEERPDRMHLRVATLTPVEFVRHFSEIWRGDYANPSTLFDYLVESLQIELDPPTDFQIGGDARGKRAKLELALSPTPIRLVDFYAPPTIA
ncbi:MAG TPA: diacylglycerol kinase family protein [Polyangiaceae bacterium]|nr:diacylglycerol kinase family protein [Polyangiaceae bacterium]